MPSVSIPVETSRPVLGHLTINEVIEGPPCFDPDPLAEVNSRPVRASSGTCERVSWFDDTVPAR